MLWKLALVAALAIDVLGNDTMLRDPSLEAKEPTEAPTQKKDNKTESKDFVLTDENKKQIKDLVTAICTKNNRSQSSPMVNDAILEFINCSHGLFNPFAIQDEVVAARKNGTHGKVIKKHCKLSEKLKGCIHEVTAGVTPCVPKELREYFARVDNATDSLIDYICEKKGKKIAKFITENGIECFKEKSELIMGCAKSLASRRTEEDMPVSAMCKMYDQLTQCVVTVVQGCPGLAPSEMAESLLVHMRNTVTDCPEIKKEKKPESTTTSGMKDQDDLDSDEQNKEESSRKKLRRIGEL